MKLNLGAGKFVLDGYDNLDIKNGEKVYPLVAYAENSVDEIRASHILEHFGRAEVKSVLRDWIAKLKAGGVLRVAVPDFGKIVQRYNNGEDLDYPGFIYGGQTDANDFHRSFFDEKGLKKTFESLGLTDIKTWQSELKDCASYPISLNLEGTKSSAEPVEQDIVGEVNYVDKAYLPFLEEMSRAKSNTYSQNGEDGIIEAIFNKIGTQNNWCLEVGASDGIMFSNTRRLVEQGWNAILIEKDKAKYDRLVENCKAFPLVRTLNLEIGGENSLDKILKDCGAPEEIDLVCIDIDGQDWHIWNQLIDFKPRVVMIEYDNSPDKTDFIPSVGGEGQAGKSVICKLAASKLYYNIVLTKYNAIAIKNNIKVFMNPADAAIIAKNGSEVKPQNVNVAAVMSMPRLAFTDNMFSAIRSLIPLGINLERGCGVFWGQVLTRLMEMHINDNTDYILTLDYDTYFTKNYVVKLLQLMQENPDVDAIVPLQIKRESDFPMIGCKTDQQTILTKIPVEEFQAELMPIITGHFGLTIFRMESLKKLKKPWFLPTPDPNGGWDEGRRDEDIYFWHNFAACGLKACLAPGIGLPHLQMMATVPGRLQDGLKPVHCYLTDLDKNGIPEWCEPKVEMKK